MLSSLLAAGVLPLVTVTARSRSATSASSATWARFWRDAAPPPITCSLSCCGVGSACADTSAIAYSPAGEALSTPCPAGEVRAVTSVVSCAERVDEVEVGGVEVEVAVGRPSGSQWHRPWRRDSSPCSRAALMPRTTVPGDGPGDRPRSPARNRRGPTRCGCRPPRQPSTPGQVPVTARANIPRLG